MPDRPAAGPAETELGTVPDRPAAGPAETELGTVPDRPATGTDRPATRPPARVATGEDMRSTPTDAVRVQILATEHWSLLATRTMVWNEAYSRTSIFLTVLSATVVALALVAQATDGQRAFSMFALLLLPVVLFLGLATYARLTVINTQDGQLVIGMNRLRHGYLDIAPDLEPYFITGQHDDLDGIMQTVAMGRDELRRGVPIQVLASTPGIVAVINGVVAGVLSGLVTRTAGLATEAAVAVGVGAALLVLVVLLLIVPARIIGRWTRTHTPRFPR